MPEADVKPAETYRRLLRYVRPYWWIVAAVVVPAAIYAVVGTAVPLLMGSFIDQLGDAARNSQRAWLYPVLIVLGFPIRGAMDVLTVYGLAWVGRSVIRDLRNPGRRRLRNARRDRARGARRLRAPDAGGQGAHHGRA